jgi:pyruvate carboxylase
LKFRSVEIESWCIHFDNNFTVIPWFVNIQIAGLPTNVGFLQELASHSSFEKGIVDTHFIERYKDDLLSTSTKASGESHDVAELGAILAAACICKKDHITSKESIRMLAPTILLFSFTTLFCYDVLMTQYVLFRS